MITSFVINLIISIASVFAPINNLDDAIQPCHNQLACKYQTR